MYAFSNHNAKGFYTDLFEEALASILDIIDVKEAYTHFQYLEQPRKMRAGGGEDENLTSYVKISMGAIFMTRCGVFIFEPRWEYLTPGNGSRSPGIVHIAFSKSISDHLANRSSLERIKMSNVSFTANFVSFLPLKLSIRSKSSENRSNGKAGLWILLATAIAPAIS